MSTAPGVVYGSAKAPKMPAVGQVFRIWIPYDKKSIRSTLLRLERKTGRPSKHVQEANCSHRGAYTEENVLKEPIGPDARIEMFRDLVTRLTSE